MLDFLNMFLKFGRKFQILTDVYVLMKVEILLLIILIIN